MSALVRVTRGPSLDILASVFGVLAGALGFSVILILAGHDAVAIWKAVIAGAFGTRTAVTETIVTTIPILLCALAVAIPARAGLINIGGEGQLLAGAIGATWAALTFGDQPSLVVLPLMALSAVALGGAWGLVPGLLRAAAGANEAVVSLFMNFVASLWLLHLIHGPWRDPSSRGWAQTVPFSPAALLPHLPGTRIHLMIVVALLLAVGLWAVMAWTSTGLTLRLLETSPRAATYAGINSGPYLVAVLVLGGMVAGLAGLGEVSAIHGRLREGISTGFGYTGFLVAWLCGHRAEVIPLGALLLGGLTVGADVLRVTAGLPFATVQVLQGMILVGVIGFHGWAANVRSRAPGAVEGVARHG